MADLLTIDVRLAGVDEELEFALTGAIRDLEERLVRVAAQEFSEVSGVSEEKIIDRELIGSERSDDGFSIVGTDDPIPVKRFNPRETDEGVEFRHPAGETRTIEDAFIVDKLNEQVFKRAGRERYPITRQDVAITDDEWLVISDQLRGLSGENVAREFATELEQRLG